MREKRSLPSAARLTVMHQKIKVESGRVKRKRRFGGASRENNNANGSTSNGREHPRHVKVQADPEKHAQIQYSRVDSRD